MSGNRQLSSWGPSGPRAGSGATAAPVCSGWPHPERSLPVEPHACAGCGGDPAGAPGRVTSSVQVFDIPTFCLAVTDYLILRHEALVGEDERWTSSDELEFSVVDVSLCPESGGELDVGRAS